MIISFPITCPVTGTERENLSVLLEVCIKDVFLQDALLNILGLLSEAPLSIYSVQVYRCGGNITANYFFGLKMA